jgi:hypothetical protein
VARLKEETENREKY